MDVFLKVKAGKISSAALGATFGATGINVKKLIDEINDKTKQDIGLRVVLKVEIDTLTRTHKLFYIEQPIAYKLQKIGKKTFTNKELLTFVNENYNNEKYDSIDSMYKQVVGTCKSIGINVTE